MKHIEALHPNAIRFTTARRPGAATAERRHSSILHGRGKHSAVGESNLAKIDVVAAAFDAVANQGDLVPDLHGSLTPALPGQRVGAIRFGDPFFNSPILARNIEMD
jgi:hypothetical protein